MKGCTAGRATYGCAEGGVGPHGKYLLRGSETLPDASASLTFSMPCVA